MTLRCSILSLLFSGAALLAQAPPLFCDMGVYPPLQLTWSQNADLKQVNGVFPHPLLTQRVAVTTRTGVWLSDDAGLTWKALPEADAEKVGVIKKVEFHPTEIDTFYLASQSKGIWVTNNGGKSFRQVGTQANGMAADATEDMIIYPLDTFHQTLLVVHGAAAGGISRSRDAGQTWDILSADYLFRRVLVHEKDLSDSKELYLVGSSREEPEIQSLYICTTLGEPAVEIMHDVIFTDLVFSLSRKNDLYVATSDSGLYRVEITPFSPDIKPLGSKGDNWASVSTTWGPNADVLSVALYDPSKQGFILSNDNLATSRDSIGLPVGTFVKEGAVVRPNANGTIFYASVNQSLMVGRPDETVPVVNVTPAAFEPVKDIRVAEENLILAFDGFLRVTNNPTNSTAKAAADLIQNAGDLEAVYRHNQMTITARVPLKPAPPISVTADLSRLGGSEATPMFDDGRHEDGAAGDGVYGFSFCFQPSNYNNERGDDWRRTWPGRVAIGVTATYADGSRQGAVGVVGIYPKIESLILSGYYQNWMGFSVEGDVKAEPVPNAKELHGQPTTALCIHAGHGPWSVLLNTNPWSGGDITGYQAFSFGIRVGDGTPPKELYVQLRDNPVLSEATTTDRVGVTHDYVKEGSISSEYRTVVVPFAKLLGNKISQFQTSKQTNIILSGDGGDPVTLFIDWPCYLAPNAEPNSALKVSTK